MAERDDQQPPKTLTEELELFDDLDKALIDYNASLDLNSKQADVWYAKADASYNLGNIDQALSSYRKSLDLSPRDVECWIDYGSTLLEHGDVIEALQAFSECTRIQPDWAEGYYATAKALCVAGQPLSSIEYLKRAFILAPYKLDDFEREFPAIAGPLGMEYLRDMLQRDTNGDIEDAV